MNLPRHLHALAAARGESRAGAVRVESGVGPGFVVDGNRPAIQVATARGLLKQFGAAH